MLWRQIKKQPCFIPSCFSTIVCMMEQRIKKIKEQFEKVLVTLYKEMEKRKMKENIIIRLERENEYHEVENLVR